MRPLNIRYEVSIDAAESNPMDPTEPYRGHERKILMHVIQCDACSKLIFSFLKLIKT